MFERAVVGETEDEIVKRIVGNPDRRGEAAAGLAVATKPDSQEICFIPGGDYSAFLRAYLDEQDREMPDTAGELVSSTGEVLGAHAGIHNFTVGQRKGLGVSSPNPMYVLNIDPATNRVTAGSDSELLSRNLFAHRINWITIPELTSPRRVHIKIRHRHEPAPALLLPAPGGSVRALFDEPQRAITPGQSAVFYDGDDVVGGGWITVCPD